MKSISIILIVFGIGIIVAEIFRGYVSDTASGEGLIEGQPIRILEGIWSPRKVYLNIKVYGGSVDILFYSNGIVLKRWNNTTGFIDRIDILRRGRSYILIMPRTNKTCRVSVRTTFYGVEKDILTHGFIFIILGTMIYMISFVKLRRFLPYTLFLLLLFNINIFYATPNWFKQGIYARYASKIIDDVSILFKNNTVINGKWKVYVYLKCSDIDGDMAKLFVNITLIGLNNFSPTFSRADYVLLNLSSRRIFYKGKNIGITCIFLEDIPKEGEKIALIEIDDYKVNGTVKRIKIIPMNNFGYQNAIAVKFNITMNGVYANGSETTLSVVGLTDYDTDTGIILDGLWVSDPLFLIADIKMMIVDLNLIETNIDIGPSDIATEIQSWLARILVISIIITPIILVSYIIYKRKISAKRKIKNNTYLK
ncbi:MAG TPA: hypothetical protein ENG40_02075 [Thermoprotei archaeon]|nr:hypothetical protein [Thermoprotei archaeon]